MISAPARRSRPRIVSSRLAAAPLRRALQLCGLLLAGLLAGGASAAAQTPTVTAISPGSATAAGGTRVTLTGTNFTGASGVTIGGVAATGLVVINATTLTCITPAGTAGPASVLVTTPGGTTAANSFFTYAVWPGQVYAWGHNSSGQLGNG
jgi:hypothetical protein